MATLDVAGLNRQGKVFTAGNISAKNHIAVTTSMTGLILHNPIGSGVKVVLVDLSFSPTTVPAAIAQLGVGILPPQGIQPAATLTAAGAPASAADGSGNVGRAIAWDAAVLAVAPVARRWSFHWGATTALGPTSLVDRVDGSIILVPGATLCTTVVSVTIAGMAAFTWAEVPV